jgi:RNA polymerase sigma factor (sigma-70 family)
MADEPAEVGTAPASPSVDLRAGEALEAPFNVFYRGYTPRLVRFLVLDGAPPGLAAELAQEVMIELWREWDAVRSPKAWARRAASRKWIRYRTTVPELPVDMVPESGPLLSSEDAERVLVEHDLLRLLDLLTPRQRQVMALTYDGDTPAEIADELSITEATVRSTQRTARQQMAEYRRSRQEGGTP